MRRDVLLAMIVIVVAFALLLPLYYVFSYGKNDALEHTVQQGNQTAGNGGYNAPFSYGGNYLESLVLGILGMVIVFALAYLIMVAMKRRRKGRNE